MFLCFEILCAFKNYEGDFHRTYWQRETSNATQLVDKRLTQKGYNDTNSMELSPS
jgi:hypothetical protein